MSLLSAQIQKPPVFRARTDLLQLDVTVLDKDRRPVRGLTAEDFDLFEDNVRQTIEGFSSIDVPDRVVPGPVWDKVASPDVTTNEIDNQRIFVLVLDDGLGLSGNDPSGKREMKRTARAFVDWLGPKDLAAVVFTGTTYSQGQNLTSDRARLIRAIESYPDNDNNLEVLQAPKILAGGPDNSKYTDRGAEKCRGKKEVLQLFDALVRHLSSLPDRRKAIIYYGGQMPWAVRDSDDLCGTYWVWRDVFAQAQQGHVTISPVDTWGLKPGRRPDGYLTVAAETGGRAIVATNDFIPGLRQILVENSSYYLLAYQPTNAAEDGTFRRLKVTVKNRPDVEVITRRNYWAPRTKTTDEPAAPPPPQLEAMAGLLPDSKLVLRVTAAPFAVPGSERTEVALALGIRQPAFANRTAEQVNVLVRAFTADGDPKGSDEQTIPITVPAPRDDEDVSRYDVLTRIELPKPGKYEVRLSAHSDVSDTRGSVYVDVDVPDFHDDKVSLSGVVVNSALGAPVEPVRALRDLTPLAPTTERTFATTDFVTAFLRVYQGGGDKLADVRLGVEIQDATGKRVVEKTESLAAGQFGDERSADFQFRLPLQTLAAGEYLLTFEAARGKTTARRDVRFQVR